MNLLDPLGRSAGSPWCPATSTPTRRRCPRSVPAGAAAAQPAGSAGRRGRGDRAVLGADPALDLPGRGPRGRRRSTRSGTARCSSCGGRPADDVLDQRTEYAAGAQVDSQFRAYPFLAGAGASSSTRPSCSPTDRSGVPARRSSTGALTGGRRNHGANGSGFHRGRRLRADLRRGGCDDEVDRGGRPGRPCGSAAAWSPWRSPATWPPSRRRWRSGRRRPGRSPGRAVKSIVFASPARPIVALAADISLVGS